MKIDKDLTRQFDRFYDRYKMQLATWHRSSSVGQMLACHPSMANHFELVCMQDALQNVLNRHEQWTNLRNDCY